MEEETEPQEDVIDEVMDEAIDEQEAVEPQEEEQIKQVPLSALQKERQKRQERDAEAERLRIELQYLKEQFQQRREPEEEDDSLHDAVTKGDLSKNNEQTIFEAERRIEERLWKKANPEAAQMVDDNLSTFLKQKPHYAAAINAVTNRYEEAYSLMAAMTPRERREVRKEAPKKPAPGNPTGVPKSAAINEVVDVMGMSDSEYRAWRAEKRRRR